MGAVMNDFKQRFADWHEYRRIHRLDSVIISELPHRSFAWFLFQSVEQRKKLEEEEIEELEQILEEKRQEIRKKKNAKAESMD